MRQTSLQTTRLLAISLPLICGCFNFDPPDIRVNVSHASPSDGQSEWTSHGWTLRKVMRQRNNVLEQMNDGDWDDVEDEIVDWQDEISDLRAYAGSSSDPATFRRYCDDLEATVDRVRKAADLKDQKGVRSNCDAAQVILNRFERDFPMTKPKTAAP